MRDSNICCTIIFNIKLLQMTFIVAALFVFGVFFALLFFLISACGLDTTKRRSVFIAYFFALVAKFV